MLDFESQTKDLQTRDVQIQPSQNRDTKMITPLSYEDYRSFLKAEYEDRITRNSRYSLRAYARDIGIRASRLNDILHGRDGLSRTTATEVGTKIGLANEHLEYFIDLVESSHARSKTGRELAKARLTKYKKTVTYENLSLDAFAAISDWVHFAILELFAHKEFRSDSIWIANSLKISPMDAQEALQRLLRLGMIRQEEGRFVLSQTHSEVKPKTPSEAIKNFHRQILGKALQTLDQQPMEKREFITSMMSFNQSNIQEAKHDLQAFVKNFSEKYSASNHADDVYCLSTQFFSLLPKLSILAFVSSFLFSGAAEAGIRVIGNG